VATSTLLTRETEQWLAESAVGSLRRTVRVPSYDRGGLTNSVVHFGAGCFHRAHQAVYLDELAERGISAEWGAVGVSLRSGAVKRALAPQGCMYTVLERGPECDEARVIGAITRLCGPDDSADVRAALVDPQTKLVTLTVTGDGYKVDPESGQLDEGDPDLLHDLWVPSSPVTLHGHVVNALRLRRERGLPPFSVVSCDNLPDNGQTTRNAIVSFARLGDERLADWIEDNVAFPATVVDRITPRTTARERALLARDYGLRDRWPVVAESFSQWIIEDHFSNERPPLEEVGVRFVADAGPYELVKKRMLNGAHCAIAYVGLLAGHRRIDEAMGDADLRGFIEALLDHEVIPQLPQPPGIDLGNYKRTVVDRFTNPRIGDQLQRLAARGSTKMPAYLLPSLQAAVRDGLPRRRLTHAVAAWIVSLRGVDLNGRPIEIEDAMLGTLRPLAREAARDCRPLLAERDVFGELGRNGAFAEELRRAVHILEAGGPIMPLSDSRAEPLAA